LLRIIEAMFKYYLFFLSLSLSLTASWAEKTLAQLSRAEKIGQLITMRVEMVDDMQEIITKIERCKIGGIIPLHPWTLEKHNKLIDNLHTLHQDMIKIPVAAYGSVGLCVPILIIEDSEWGCAMRIQELPPFPRALTLGALYPEDTDLIHQIGYAIGEQCQALGIHLNCAPVVDVNSNYNNPVIGMRSFGSVPEAVGQCAVAYIMGMQDAGTLACIKHFPGHGNTDKDSHFNLPTIKAEKSYIEANDIAPFIYCLKNSTPAVMVGHLAVPALAPDESILPATLSPTIIRNYLQEQLGFSGLVISDALDMHALAAYGDPGDIALQALKAGIDILLCPPDIDAVINRITDALDTGEYTETELDTHVLKILQVKEKLGLHAPMRIMPKLEFYEDLIEEAYGAAATACNDFDAPTLSVSNYTSVTIGTPRSPQAPFYDPATLYTKPLLIHIYPGNYKTHRLSAELKNTLEQITKQHPGSIAFLFGSPYCLMDIPNNVPALVLYEDTPFTHLTAQKIMSGELKPQGKLPITI
jgi:beta-N-acetylhexosaminidase